MDSEQQQPTVDKRKALLAVGLAVVLTAAGVTAVGEAAQFTRVGAALRRADKLWLPLCLAGQLLAYAGYVFAYRDAARASGGPRFSFWITARIVIFGQGASVLGASVGGLAVDFWALHRAGAGRHTAARRVLALGTIEWAVLSLYACTAAALVLITGANAPPAMALGWLVVIPVCGALAAWFSSPRRAARFTNMAERGSKPTASAIAKALSWMRKKLEVAFSDAIAGVVLVRHLLSHPGRYHGAALGYPLYWMGDTLVLYCGLRAFGAHPAIVSLVLAYATGFVISALPLPAGGAGGIEAGMAFALTGIGVGLPSALLGVFVYRLVTFWLPVLPALLLLPSVRELNRELPHVPHAPPDRDEGPSFRPREEATT